MDNRNKPAVTPESELKCGNVKSSTALNLTKGNVFGEIQTERFRSKAINTARPLKALAHTGLTVGKAANLPHEIIATGDSAYLTLSLVCRWFRDVVTNEIFQKAAHFAWLDCVVNWKKNSPDYCDEFRRIYSFRECLELFLSPIHQGTGEEED
ncbi:hypothetical protein F2P79_002109 [Pimephales promelas]|nr:hypothetical protein F2P79_002109 [Pimephales promelas]